MFAQVASANKRAGRGTARDATAGGGAAGASAAGAGRWMGGRSGRFVEKDLRSATDGRPNSTKRPIERPIPPQPATLRPTPRPATPAERAPMRHIAPSHRDNPRSVVSLRQLRPRPAHPCDTSPRLTVTTPVLSHPSAAQPARPSPSAAPCGLRRRSGKTLRPCSSAPTTSLTGRCNFAPT